MPTATTSYVDAEAATKADLASPTLTGDPKVPTPSAGDGDTSIASTAFVQQAANGVLVEVASDGAAAILNTTSGVFLAASTTGDKAIATTSSLANQKVNLFLLAASGGSYTLAVEGGTLTLNAASESAVVQRTAENDAWKVVGLSGATIV